MANQLTKEMNAEIFTLGPGHKTLVIAKPTGFNLAYPEVLITIEGAWQKGIAEGIVEMLNERQCFVCGKFNGLHGEIFRQTSADNGEVRGRYETCPNDTRKVQ